MSGCINCEHCRALAASEACGYELKCKAKSWKGKMLSWQYTVPSRLDEAWKEFVAAAENCSAPDGCRNFRERSSGTALDDRPVSSWSVVSEYDGLLGLSEDDTEEILYGGAKGDCSGVAGEGKRPAEIPVRYEEKFPSDILAEVLTYLGEDLKDQIDCAAHDEDVAYRKELLKKTYFLLSLAKARHIAVI